MLFFAKYGGIRRAANFIEGLVNPKISRGSESVDASINIKKTHLGYALIASVVGVLLLFTLSLLFAKNDLSGFTKMALSAKPVVKQLRLVGEIEPKRQRTVSAPFEGQILESNVVIGQRVDKGTVLIKIDTREIQTKLNQAEVNLIQAQQKFDEVKDWQNSLDMSRQRRELKKASAMLEKAQQSVTQSRKLFDLGIISKNEYDADLDALANAREQQVSAHEQHQATLKKGNATQIEIAQRELQNANYNAENIRKKASAGSIVAPINGVILPSKKKANDFDDSNSGYLINSGDTVERGQKLFLIATTDKLQVRTKIDEVDMRSIELGQTVQVSSDSLPDLFAKGRIISIAHQGSKDFDRPDIPLFDMIVSLGDASPEYQQSLRLGGNVNVVLETYRNDNALVVPFSAISAKGGEKTVQLVSSKHGITSRVIEIGISLADGVEVLSGLDVDDVILIPEG